MDNLLNQFKLIYKKDKLSILLIVFISFCFKQTHLICVCVVSIISLYKLIQVKTKKIDSIKLCKTYFYLLVYSLIFTGFIVKVILFFLLLYLYMIPNHKQIKKNNFYSEKIVLIFFSLITLNHLIFKPYFMGLDVFIHYLLIPILFIKLKKVNININIYQVLRVYISSVIIASVFLLVINILQRTLVFSVHTFFAEYIGISHVYYGMFIGVAISFLLILDLYDTPYFSKIFSFSLIITLTSLLFYIGARISLIGTLVILGIYMYKKNKMKVYIKLPFVVLSIVIVALFSLKFTRVQQGINNIENVYNSVKNNDREDLVKNSWRNMYKRFLITSYSLEEVKKHPFLGVGLQNVKSHVSKKVIDDGYKYFKPINSHNQYLEFLVAMGFLGLLYFLFMQFSLFNNTTDIFIFFSIFITIIMLTESLIVREKGILVFLFFSLLLSQPNND